MFGFQLYYLLPKELETALRVLHRRSCYFEMVDLYGNKLITLLMRIITIKIISIIIMLIIIIIVMGIIEFRSGHSTTWLFLCTFW